MAMSLESRVKKLEAVLNFAMKDGSFLLQGPFVVLRKKPEKQDEKPRDGDDEDYEEEEDDDGMFFSGWNITRPKKVEKKEAQWSYRVENNANLYETKEEAEDECEELRRLDPKGKFTYEVDNHVLYE